MLKTIDVKTEGIGETVKELRKIKPDLAKRLPREMRQAAKPLVADARRLIPEQAPLSNWQTPTGGWIERGRDRSWNSKTVRSGVRIVTNTGARKGANQIQLLALQEKDPVGAIFENAGRNRAGNIKSSNAGDRFIAALNAKKQSPRFLWPAVEQNLRNLDRDLQKVINSWTKELERTLSRY